MAKSCELGELNACSDLGIALLLGQGLTADPERGVRTLQKACDAGGARACNNLATAYVNGVGGVTVDVGEGLRLAVKACDLGEQQGCNLAQLLRGR
ncbi:hypothetical protein [Nannocystis pusilla]|uniref:hypothetical protein n=1 Tax=Nannocystis pusilla TaxID=889268 RepID=UPI003B7B4EA4